MEEVEAARKLLDFLETGKRVLSARIVMLLALILTFLLYAWSIYKQDWLQLAGATIFGLLVFLPTIWLDITERKR